MYGAEAMTSQEPKHGSPRSDPGAILGVDELTTKDLLDEDRVDTLNTLNKYQEATKSWRDLVLIRTARIESQCKLEPKQEGPFVIKKKTSLNSYRLANQTGVDLEHSWNVDNMRKILPIGQCIARSFASL
jgi:3-dehydroquinate dehydratase